MNEPVVIAIDGPGSAGKSTIARAVAARLGLDHLDTGAMYRAVTHTVLSEGLDPTDAAAVSACARRAHVEVDHRVWVDGADVTDVIRSPEVTEAVSAVSAHPDVRTVLADQQRAWAQRHGGAVAEGRDIGTVVFPDATVKIFLTARPDVRARRRAAETGEDPVAIQAALQRRDRADATRATAPLVEAPDAVVVDTSDLDVAAVVEAIVDIVIERTGRSAPS